MRLVRSRIILPAPQEHRKRSDVGIGEKISSIVELSMFLKDAFGL
jgi:hypothetical protein